jgi:hypothetical protein
MEIIDLLRYSDIDTLKFVMKQYYRILNNHEKDMIRDRILLDYKLKKEKERDLLKRILIERSK